jgi:drug/metabolite transporter (DMT)-like permease
LKTRICLLITVLANALGNIVLSMGMRQVGSIATYSPVQLALSSLRAMANPLVLTGVGLLIIFFVTHMLVLNWADLSYVLPVTSIGYVVVAVLSWWLLKEPIKPVRWLGILVITAGVMMVSGTPHATVEPQPASPSTES